MDAEKKRRAVWNIIIVVLVVGMIVYLATNGLLSPFQNKVVNTQLSGAPSDLLSPGRKQTVLSGLNYLNRKNQVANVNFNQTIPSPAMLYNTVPGLGTSETSDMESTMNKEKIEWGGQDYPIDEDLFNDNKLSWQY